MDVKMDSTRYQELRDKLRGLPLADIRTRLAELRNQGLISEDEYNDLYNDQGIAEESADWQHKAGSDFVVNSDENAGDNVFVVAENGDVMPNVLEIREWNEEEPIVNTLADVAEPTVNEVPVEPTANPESEKESEPTSAPETPNTDNNEKDSEATPAQETPNTDNSEKDSESTPTQETPNTDNGEKEPWVSNYSDYLNDWSEKNPTRAVEKLEAEKSSLKASFKDGVALNFSSSSNVAVKAAEPSSPKASDFDALLEVAKKSNQKIRLSDKMSDEFRYALIEACAKGGVEIVNLSEKGKSLYNDFVAEQQGATLQDVEPEVNNSQETVENKSKQKPETPLTATVVTTAALFGAMSLSSCHTPTQQKDSVNQDGYQQYVESDSTALPADTLQLTGEDFAQNDTVNTPSCVPPQEWSEDLGINKRDFNIIRKAYGDAFNQAYTNAYMLQDVLGASASQILLAGRNLVAWTTSPNLKGDARFNSGILSPYGLDNLMKAIMCGDTLITENIEIYKIMVKAGNNDCLNLHVPTLAEIHPDFAYLKHNSEGYLIGSTCNQMAYIYECGSEKDAHFNMRDCGCNDIPENIEIRVQTVIDTPVVQIPVDTTTYVDTVVTPVDTVEKVAQVPSGGGVRRSVSTSYNNGKMPASDFQDQVNNPKTNIWRGTKHKAKRVVNKFEPNADARAKYYVEINGDDDSKVPYNNQAAQDNQGNWNYSQRTNEGR